VRDLQSNGIPDVTFHVVTGLAGGTGSGSIIDVVAQLRDVYPDSKRYPILTYALLPVDRPILGRGIDHLKFDHQVKSASQELAGQPGVQPANPSAFHTLTLRISVRTDWTG
jgi:hypothetical protein